MAPLFGRLGVPGTFYVSPGLFGKQHWRVPGDAGRLLDEDEARALAADGMELGSHALSHPDLRLLDGRELAFELRESKAAVEQLTGRPCRTLSYPYGLYDERVTEAAAEAGYELAFAGCPGRGDRWQRRDSPLRRGTALSASPSSWLRTARRERR